MNVVKIIVAGVLYTLASLSIPRILLRIGTEDPKKLFGRFLLIGTEIVFATWLSCPVTHAEMARFPVLETAFRARI